MQLSAILARADGLGVSRSSLSRQHGPSYGAGLLEMLVCELHATALSAAVIASAANALGGRGQAPGKADIERHIPRETDRIRLLMAMSSEDGGVAGDLALARDFLASLETVLPLVDDFFRDAMVLGMERAAVLHWRPLSDGWRNVCPSRF